MKKRAKGICDKSENGGCASSQGGRGNKQGQVEEGGDLGKGKRELGSGRRGHKN